MKTRFFGGVGDQTFDLIVFIFLNARLKRLSGPLQHEDRDSNVSERPVM